MNIDFSKIDDINVGYAFEPTSDLFQSGMGKGFRRIPLKFKDLVRPYLDGLESRWQVYSELRNKLNNISKAQVSRRNVDIELEAVESSMREAMRNGLDLMTEFYISKGNIENSPFFSNL